MPTQTLEFNATPGLTLTARLFVLGSDTIVQSVSATAKTNDKGRYFAAFTDLPIGRYRLNAFIGANGGYANETYRIPTLATAKYFPDSEPQDAVFPPIERPTDDTSVIEFYWPISGATFANSATTCKRRFLGETGAQEEALSGAITAISGKPGWYKIAYAVADRAATGTTVIPTSVTYTLVDDSGNIGELTLVIVEFASATEFAILPGRDRAVADAGASTITVKSGEIITIARAVVDANGLPMNLSGFTNLQFVVQDARGVDLAVVNHDSITVSGANSDTYSFVTTSAMTAKLGVFDFSLNQVGGGQIVGGKWIVLRRAVAD